VTALLLLAIAAGCQHSAAAKQDAVKDDAKAAQLTPYPHAAWRLARGQLDRVVLRLRHIAIRHRDSDPTESPLRSLRWVPDEPVARSREDAIRRAQEVASQLAERPDDFAAVAQKYSDDPVTAPWGGMLGTISAAKLPDEFLDAIVTLTPGAVSRPFETVYGVHIVKLEATPPEQWLSADRIAVVYQKSSLDILRPGRDRNRTRAEALALAQQIVVEARAPGADFAQLVERYTDSPDVVQHGDLGVWSTHDAMTRSLMFDVLSSVPIGGVTDPVDSGEGIQILRRTPADERERFAAAYVIMRDRPEEGSTGALAKMNEVSAAVRKHPEQFESYQHSICCAEPWVWTRGRGLGPEVEAALGKLDIDAITPAPIATTMGVYLVKRLPIPPDAPPVAKLVHLPMPTEPDLDQVLRDVDGPMFASSLHMLQQSVSELPFPAAKRQELSQVLVATSEQMLHATRADRPALLARFWEGLAEVLSPEELQQLRSHVLAFAKYRLMQN
jgi:parvulin-like peptidyl-prolyl isomerase